MTTDVFCSVCTVNHSAYAETLYESLRNAGHGEPHYVLIIDADRAGRKIVSGFSFTPVYLDEVGVPKVDELIDKYSAFELSNVLRPFFMEWLLKNHPEIRYLVYLDTDIYVYDRLDAVFEYAGVHPEASVILTPHLFGYEAYKKVSDYRFEKAFFAHGLYNSGFYVFKNDQNSRQFLAWHKDKLFDHCYNAPHAYMFVDQKILDLAPLLFDFVSIYKNKAYNIAHWNYSPGLIKEKGGTYYVGDDKLVFFHFSQLRAEVTGNFYFDISAADAKLFKKMAADYLVRLRGHGHEERKKIPYGFKDIYDPPPLSLIDPLSAMAKEKEADPTKTELATELANLYRSRAWRLAVRLRRAADFMMPKQSLRRKALSVPYSGFRQSLKYLRMMLRRSYSSILKLKGRFIGYRSRKHRAMHIGSKKLVFVGHSYHQKTKSSAFLIDLLKRFYHVEVISDESWLGKPFPDMSFVDERYLGVVFFQTLPPKKILRTIHNDNLIHFPMFDASGDFDLNYWDQYRDLKMINFSKTLHDRLQGWGLESLYLQYFPKPGAFTPGKKDEVFFWQRVPQIDATVVSKLVRKVASAIHVHTAMDPGRRFVKPPKKFEDDFRVTYSDWFENKDDMVYLMRQKGIYIAPREYEGIGMSFLEAMAMGKAVVAVDNPTMNEYIVDGKTGYLFNLERPGELDTTNIEQVQKNAYEFMCKGYAQWMSNRDAIIDFIERP